MQNVPANFKTALATNHKIKTRFSLFHKGVFNQILPNIITGSGSATISMDITSGQSQRTLSLSIIDPTNKLVPGVSTLLQPANNEIFVEYAIDDGFSNWLPYIPCGVFSINSITSSTSATDGVGPIMAISGSDRAYLVAAATMTEPYQTLVYSRLRSATQYLIQQLIPWLPNNIFNLNDNGFVLTSQVISSGNNPWAAIQSWWNDAGFILYWDATGNLVGRPYNKNNAPTNNYQKGDQASSSISIPWQAGKAYNGVIVSAVNAETITSISGVTPQQNVTFAEGKVGNWQVPNGVLSIDVIVLGGAGSPIGGPGNGDSVSGTITVYPGDILTYNVGDNSVLGSNKPGQQSTLSVDGINIVALGGTGNSLPKLSSSVAPTGFIVNSYSNGGPGSISITFSPDVIVVAKIPPVQATAWDDVPASPTYYLGPFGMHPAPLIQSSVAQTTADCLAAAELLLPTHLSILRPITLNIISDPSLEGYDTATFNFPNEGINYSKWMLQSFSLTLDHSELMSTVWTLVD